MIVDAYPDVTALFRSVVEGETATRSATSASSPRSATGRRVPTADNLNSAIEGETYEYSEMCSSRSTTSGCSTSGYPSSWGSSAPSRSGCTTGRRSRASRRTRNASRGEETTSTVHYVKFPFSPEHVDAFAAGPIRIVVDHPNYDVVVELTEEQRSELLGDLRD